MPYSVVKHGSTYAVISNITGKVHAKHTTKEKAMAQMRLLYGIHAAMDMKSKVKK